MMHILFVTMAAILILAPLIAIHEFGHYWVARRLGVKVLVYSVGFGPTLLDWTSKKSGINYRLSALPFGGYVRMLDEREGTVAAHEQHLAFNRQSPWRRIAIVAAGPLINLLLAVLLFWILSLPVSQQLNTRIGKILPHSAAAQVDLRVGDKIIAVDGHATPTWEKLNYALLKRMGETGQLAITVERQQQRLDKALPIDHFIKTQNQSPLQSLGFLPYQPAMPPIIHELVKDGAAIQQGLRHGDRIVALNSQSINDWSQVVDVIRGSAGVPLHLMIQRGQQQLAITLTPQARKDAMGQVTGYIGAGIATPQGKIPPQYLMTVQYTPLEAVAVAFDKTYQLSLMTVSGLVKMVKGLIGLENLSGPITIAKVAGQSAAMGWQTFLGFMAIMSVSLGILNLLPIPMLDGGHLVYYAIEALRGRPVSEQVQLFGLKIGMALLGTMMVLAIFNDVMRL